MKLLTYALPGDPADRLGALSPYGRILPLEQFGLSFSSMNALIDAFPCGLPKEITAAVQAGTADSLSFDEIVRRPPIPSPRQDVLCLGVNYEEHARESARFKGTEYRKEKTWAVYFSKRVHEAVADGGVIPAHADVTSALDYEAELAVIIGKEARNVPAGRACEYIFGYTILNDVSARDIQTRHKQWYLGKSLDGFCPMGPWIVTADEFDGPPLVPIRSRINGELRQNGHTSNLIFSIPEIIEDLSAGMTLYPGTIISTGTPAGVGMGFVPPKYLSAGDTVECEIEKIGVLRNTVG